VVSVLAASKFVPSATAIGLMPDHIGVKIQVQITNGSQNPVDLVLTTVHVSYGVAGYPAESIFDTASGIGSGFEGQVAPGKTATAWYGFSVSPDGAGDLSIEVSPAFSGYDSVLFSGGVSQG